MRTPQSKTQKAIDDFISGLDKDIAAAENEVLVKRSALDANDQSHALAVKSFKAARDFQVEYNKLSENYAIPLTQIIDDTAINLTSVQELNAQFSTDLSASITAIKDMIDKLIVVANAACEVSNATNSGQVKVDLPPEFLEMVLGPNGEENLEMEGGNLAYRAQQAFNKSVKTAGLHGYIGLEPLATVITDAKAKIEEMTTDIGQNLTEANESLSATNETKNTKLTVDIHGDHAFRVEDANNTALKQTKSFLSSLPGPNGVPSIDELIKEAQAIPPGAVENVVEAAPKPKTTRGRKKGPNNN